MFSWSAIVRGAAAKGLELDGNTLVTDRKCRRHYGTNMSVPFIHGKHAAADLYIDNFDGSQRANNQMSWMVRKGRNLSTSSTACVKRSFYQKYWVGQQRFTCLDLLASDLDQAPAVSTDSVSRFIC